MKHKKSLSNLSYQKVSLQTQSRLIDTFFQHEIPEFYHNVFINYVKNLQPLQAELSMRQEIQSLSNKSSFIQLFNKFLAEKEKYENYTRLVLSYQTQSYESQSEKLIKICEMIMHMRELHYKLVSSLLDIRQKYQENVQVYQSFEKYYYNTFAIKLDSFRKELQKTQLNHYIDFQREYDPFFMNLNLKHYHKDQKCNQAFQTLMQFPVQDSYNYLKMQKIMNDWLYIHSKKKVSQKNLDRIGLPELKNNQKLKQFHKQRENQFFRDNISSSYHIVSADKKSYYQSNRQFDIFSLQKYQQQSRQREKEQGNRDYFLNQNIIRLLQRNVTTPEKYKLRTKTQNASNQREGPTFIGRIKRFKISNARTLQNSPVIDQSKKSETLPVYYHQQINKDNKVDKIRSQLIRPSMTPQQFSYNRQKNPKDQTIQSISKNKIRLEKMNVYAITIKGTKTNNQLLQTNLAKFEANYDQEKLIQANKTSIRTLDPQMTSTLRQGRNFKTKESLDFVDNKKEQKLKKTQPISIQLEPQNNQSFKKNSNDQEEPLKRSQMPKKSKDKIKNAIREDKTKDYTKKRDEQMSPVFSAKKSDQDDLIKRKATSNVPTVIQKTYLSNQTKTVKQTYQSNLPKTIQKNSQSITTRIQYEAQTDKNTIQSKKQPEKIQTQKTTNNQNTQKNSSHQPESNKPVQTKIEQFSLPKKPVPLKEQSIIKSESGIKKSEKNQVKRQIKIRVGKYTLQSFKDYLQNYKCHKDSQKYFDFSKILKEVHFQQAYITQFFVNGQPGVLAIVYLVSNCKLVFRSWFLQEHQDPNLSFPLLKRFIEYVQKQIKNEQIYYKGVQFPELNKLGFVLKKNDVYLRKRTIQPKVIQQEFEQCLSVQCSQIKFIQKQKQDILVSAEIQNFTIQNSKISPLLLNMDEQAIPQKLKQLIKISHKIDSFKILNKLLQKQDCDSYQSGSKIIVQNIDLSLIDFVSDFRDSFVASDGFIKFYGNIVHQAEQKEIYCIKLTKNNGRVCFCKGYKRAQQVQKDLKPQIQKKVEFWVPMFNKKLYGRFKKYKSSAEVCYANWDISFSWQDELQGALKYPERVGITLQKSPFYVSIQLQDNLISIFQVNQDDYIY